MPKKVKKWKRFAFAGVNFIRLKTALTEIIENKQKKT